MSSRRAALAQVRRIEIYTRRLVEQLVGGDYKSVFRGRGVEFSDFREYMEGDDPRTIDWNVTARTGYPHVKIMTEERELSALLMVDTSASLGFGSVVMTKAERVAEISAVLALSAVRSGDRVGLLTFGSEVTGYVPPGKGRRHALGIVGRILEAEGTGRSAHLDRALSYTGRMLHRRSLLFLISDFRFAPETSRLLRATAARHDVVGINVYDPREVHFPPLGRMRLADPETGRESVVDTSSRSWRREFARRVAERRERRRELCSSSGVDLVSVSTAEDLVVPLRRFFALRRRRRRH